MTYHVAESHADTEGGSPEVAHTGQNENWLSVSSGPARRRFKKKRDQTAWYRAVVIGLES